MNPNTTFTALVVDDNYFNRDLCMLALEHVGYQVTEAVNGLEALKSLAKDSFDLLVLDLAMPELDGLGVLRQLNAQAARENMAIIIMTANPHMANDELFNKVDFMMNKPIDIEAFAQLARRLAYSRQI